MVANVSQKKIHVSGENQTNGQYVNTLLVRSKKITEMMETVDIAELEVIMAFLSTIMKVQLVKGKG